MEHIREWKQVHQFSWTTSSSLHHEKRWHKRKIHHPSPPISQIFCPLLLDTAHLQLYTRYHRSFVLQNEHKKPMFFSKRTIAKVVSKRLFLGANSDQFSPRTDPRFQEFWPANEPWKRHHSYHWRLKELGSQVCVYTIFALKTLPWFRGFYGK